MGNFIITKVNLSSANFKVLGSFTGIVSEFKRTVSLKPKEGLISKAKNKLLENAKNKGIDLKGSRTLINVTVDFVENKLRITCTISAEIIEFIK